MSSARRTMIVLAAVMLGGAATSPGAGLRPGLYHDHIHVVIHAGSAVVPPQDKEMNVCITARDIADNGRRLAQQRNGEYGQCKLSDTQFQAGRARWRMTCAHGVSGQSEAIWNGDKYKVTTTMSQPAGVMAVTTHSVVTGRRTGACNG